MTAALFCNGRFFTFIYDGSESLLHIIQCFQIFLSGTYLYHFIYAVYEDLAIANMSGVKGFLGSLDHVLNRNISNNHFYFY